MGLLPNWETNSVRHVHNLKISTSSYIFCCHFPLKSYIIITYPASNCPRIYEFSTVPICRNFSWIWIQAINSTLDDILIKKFLWIFSIRWSARVEGNMVRMLFGNWTKKHGTKLTRKIVSKNIKFKTIGHFD